jgi:HPr kinase/phosphorylase
MSKITVEKIYNDMRGQLSLEIVNGPHSFKHPITEGDLHRPGLALTGFVKIFTFERVQILGNAEIGYLSTLGETSRRAAIEKLLSFDIPCLIVSAGNKIPPEMVTIADARGITIFRSPHNTSRLMHLLSGYLDQLFAPTITVHGSLVDVYGVGVLFTGRSGIGKSEIALDLVERGHRLVADDVVNIIRQAAGILIGRGSDMLQQHMEIRGLGIIEVRSIFGIRSVRAQKRIEIEVHLEEWRSDQEYERTGLEEQTTKILDVEIPVVQLPIFPGKNITVIAEVIALNRLLKMAGYDPAKAFNEKLINRMRERTSDQLELEKYLQYDFE